VSESKVVYDLEFHFKGGDPLYLSDVDENRDSWLLNQDGMWSITIQNEDGSSESHIFRETNPDGSANVLRRKLVRREVPQDQEDWRKKLT
jgi:hypothetical protein